MKNTILKGHNRNAVAVIISLAFAIMMAITAFGADTYEKNEAFIFAGDSFVFKDFSPVEALDTGSTRAYRLTLEKQTEWYSASSASSADNPEDKEVIFVYTVENTTSPIRVMNITLEDSTGQATVCTGVIIPEPPNKQEVTFTFQLDRAQPLPEMAYIAAEVVGGADKGRIGLKLGVNEAVSVESQAIAPPADKSIYTATPSSSAILVNGENVQFDAYNIDGSNYFKLRDIAFALNGTGKQFEVSWDEGNNAIALTKDSAYTVTGGELEIGIAGNKQARATSSKIMVDGVEAALTAYNIEGNNYFKLRDIAKLFDFNIGWDEEMNTITINTEGAYAE